MKNPFSKIDSQLLINRPVIWISSIHWILGVSCLVILMDVFLGLFGKLTFNLSGLYLALVFVYIITVIIWIIFQFRNYEKVFSTKQTIIIYLLNFVGYLFITGSTILIFLIFNNRLQKIVSEDNFNRELLAIRIASLRNSDIELIKSHPQLFTSKGTDQSYNNSDTVDLDKEYRLRSMLEDNPFIKKNLSHYYSNPVVYALRKMKGYEFVDSLLTAREEKRTQSTPPTFDNAGRTTETVASTNYYVELDEDPLFYKYLTGLTSGQLDSLRNLKAQLGKKYGFGTAITDSSNEGMRKHFYQLNSEIETIEDNATLPVSRFILTITIVLIIFSISFNYIISKKTLCLLAPFIYVGLFFIFVALFEKFLSAPDSFDDLYLIPFKVNAILFLCIFIFTRFRKKLGSNMKFFAWQLLNMSALCFPLIVLMNLSDEDDSFFDMPVTGVTIVSIIVFLLIHYLFIKKIRNTVVE